MKLAFDGKYLQHPGYLSKDQDPDKLWQRNVLAEAVTLLLMKQAVKTVTQIVQAILAVRKTAALVTTAPATIVVVALEMEEVVDDEGALTTAAETILVEAVPTTADVDAAAMAATETIDHDAKIASQLNSMMQNWSKVLDCLRCIPTATDFFAAKKTTTAGNSPIRSCQER
jgi:hypothetical protein